MDAWGQLDLYCERLGPGLWAEPLNVLSNLGFVLVALALARRRPGAHPRHTLVLVVLIALVGLGSAAFHVFATGWARWFDLLFIEAFIYCYMALYLRSVFALSWLSVAAIGVLFAVFEWGVTRAFEPGSFNGSYRYLPALIAVGVMSAAAVARAGAAARYLAIACAIFLVAVALRTLDLSWCAGWPWGTHFVWHLLNALVLYFCMLALRRETV